MNILHVVSSLNVGGAERFVIDLAREQNKNANVEARILSMGVPGEPLEMEVKLSGLKLHHATGIKDIKELLNTFDIVNVHSSFCLLRILLASFFTKIKVIYTRHNERVHKSLKWRVTYLLAYYKLYKMIFVADKGKANYLKVYPKFYCKAQVILNGVLSFDINKETSHLLRIGHVGRFVQLKSQHVLIEAIDKLSEKFQNKIELSFYGNGELLNKNRDLAGKLIPNVMVNFKGVVTNRDDIYKNTDILVVTSETEGLSLAILEAMASGSPIIASNVGGNPELVKNNENGYLYEYGDSAKLAENISKFINQPEEIKRLGDKSKAIYEKEFSMKKCSDSYLNAYS
jgi:glycosyltransferase involved in cell wall biosynthesis